MKNGLAYEILALGPDERRKLLANYWTATLALWIWTQDPRELMLEFAALENRDA